MEVKIKIWVVKDDLIGTIYPGQDDSFIKGAINWSSAKETTLEVLPAKTDGGLGSMSAGIGLFPIIERHTSPDDYWNEKYEDCLPVSAIKVKVAGKEVVIDIPPPHWYKSDQKTEVTIDCYKMHTRYLETKRRLDESDKARRKLVQATRIEEFKDYFRNFAFTEQEKRWLRKYVTGAAGSQIMMMLRLRFPGDLETAFREGAGYHGEEFEELIKEVLTKGDRVMNLKYYPRLPKDYAQYWFVLKDKTKIWGYYTSFPYPHDRHIRIADLEECQFYYIEHSEIAGYFEIASE